MAKLTDKSALITPANDDLLYIVDVSDTTDSAQGTSKKIEFQNLVPVISYPSLLSKPSLGSLAPLDYLSYDALVSKPSLGSLAPLDYLSFDSLVSKPSLGSLAPLNELSYSALVSKPSLGSLSVLDSIGLTNLNNVSITSLASGQAILANASGIWTNQTISLDSAPMTFRNYIINSDMSFNQRFASAPSINTSTFAVYTADRWGTSSVGPVATQTVVDDAPAGTWIKKSIKHTINNAKLSLASGDIGITVQRLEGQYLQDIYKGTASALPMTATFWVKSNVTGTYIAEFYDLDNNRSISKPYTINTQNTWEFKSIPVPADTTGALDNDENFSIQFGLSYFAGQSYAGASLSANWSNTSLINNTRYTGQVNLANATSNYFQFTGVQLEKGSVATDLEEVPLDINQLRCFRYLFRNLPQTVAPYSNQFWGTMYTTANLQTLLRFPVRMRAIPTATVPVGVAGAHIAGIGDVTTTQIGTYLSRDGTAQSFGVGGPFTVGIIGFMYLTATYSAEL